jgi:hypothetical protein
MVECLPSKYKALGSISVAKKKKEKQFFMGKDTSKFKTNQLGKNICNKYDKRLVRKLYRDTINQ